MLIGVGGVLQIRLLAHGRSQQEFPNILAGKVPVGWGLLLRLINVSLAVIEETVVVLDIRPRGPTFDEGGGAGERRAAKYQRSGERQPNRGTSWPRTQVRSGALPLLPLARHGKS